MLEIRWATFAQRDLDKIARRHLAFHSDTAIEMLDRIVTATRILVDMPRAGQSTMRASRRRWRVSGIDYVLFYRVERDHVRILRVVHGAQELAGRL